MESLREFVELRESEKEVRDYAKKLKDNKDKSTHYLGNHISRLDYREIYNYLNTKILPMTNWSDKSKVHAKKMMKMMKPLKV